MRISKLAPGRADQAVHFVLGTWFLWLQSWVHCRLLGEAPLVSLHRLTVRSELRSRALFDLLAFQSRYRERLDGLDLLVRQRGPVNLMHDMLDRLIRVARDR